MAPVKTIMSWLKLRQCAPIRHISSIKQIEDAARKVVHLIEGEREKIIKQIPEDVKNREAACCEMQKSDGERQVLKKQARRARAHHLVKSSMEPAERKTRRKPVLELFVNGAYMGNTEDWQK